MKNFFLVFMCFFFAQKTFAQQGKYTFFCEEKDMNLSVNVKGEFVGHFEGSDYYYEKVDALNHKVKKVALRDGRLRSMDSYEVNETLIGVSNLRVKEKKSGDKTFYTIEVKPNNDKKPIMYKYYSGSKGAFDPEMQPMFTLNIPFATKAKADAFIADLQTLFK